MIRLQNVEKYFSHGLTKTYVLRQISLEIKAGEFVSIMGPSGAGKSTLLHILGMHDADWNGQYRFAGSPIHDLKPQARAEIQRRDIGFVFQRYHLIDDLTVFENLEVPLTYRNVKRSERQAMVCD